MRGHIVNIPDILLYLQTRIKKNKYKHEKKKKKGTSVMEKKCTKKCREKP
jgi:hypothetical protein